MGSFVEPDFTGMLLLKMLAGTRAGLKDMNSILLSRSLAKTFFGSEDPLNKIIRLNNKQDATVTGFTKISLITVVLRKHLSSPPGNCLWRVIHMQKERFPNGMKTPFRFLCS
jgi:hypothetical protein